MFRKEFKQEGLQKGLLKGRIEGLHEGELKGRIEGLQEGKIKGKLEGLLESKFGNAGMSLMEYIERINDINRLKMILNSVRRRPLSMFLVVIHWQSSLPVLHLKMKLIRLLQRFLWVHWLMAVLM